MYLLTARQMEESLDRVTFTRAHAPFSDQGAGVGNFQTHKCKMKQ